MKKKSALIACACYAAIIILTLAAVFISGRTYKAYVNTPYKTEKTEISYSEQGTVELVSIKKIKNINVLTFRALKEGTATVETVIHDAEYYLNSTGMYFEFTVLPTGVLYLTGYDFGGFVFLMLGITALTLCTFILCLFQFRYRRKKLFFSYKTVMDLALMLFFGLQSLMYAGITAGLIIIPYRLDNWQAYNLAGFIMSAIFLLSIPLLVLFAGFLTFSNLSLIRHEGFRKNNLFGIFISAVLFAGSLMCAVTVIKNPNSTGITMEEVKGTVIRAFVASTFVYFECILLATQICTQYAARHTPKTNQDFIMILGCKIKKDGTPLPLLRGRIDKALEFYNKQLDKTGKAPCFIPSGGQGSDEVISEAESMKNYLTGQGIDESIIYPEDKSTTTLENMKFSKAIADEHKENANILFSTTNYHVFRSGILSAKAGLRADGIGAKTKWYFWPNAQMREFIGLMAAEWKTNIVFILLMAAVPTALACIPAIAEFVIKHFG